MQDEEDLFNGLETVNMLIELPLEVYNGMKEGYDNGIASGVHKSTLEKWVGLVVCKGIQSVYEDRKRAEAEADRWVNFLPNDDFIKWLQAQIDTEESEDSSITLRKVLNKYISYGRL